MWGRFAVVRNELVTAETSQQFLYVPASPIKGGAQ